MNTAVKDDLLTLLAEHGVISNWVTAEKFAQVTGISKQKLPNRKAKWQEDLVWTKQDGNIYYSIKGYNQWLSEQAEKRLQKALGSLERLSKSTSKSIKDATSQHSHSRKTRQASKQLKKLELI